MQESLEALRQLPYVVSVDVLDKKGLDSTVQYPNLQRILDNKKKVSLIGKNGCAVFFSHKSSIIMVQSEANVNLGAIDLLLESIE